MSILETVRIHKSFAYEDSAHSDNLVTLHATNYDRVQSGVHLFVNEIGALINRSKSSQDLFYSLNCLPQVIQERTFKIQKAVS